MVSLLPSELYGDASHPLDQGYAMIAEELANTPAFIVSIPSIVRSPYGLASL
jgi:hypothetical protein